MYIFDFLVAVLHLPMLTSWRLNRLIRQGLDRHIGSWFLDDRYYVSERLAWKIKFFGQRAIEPLFKQVLSMPDDESCVDIGFLGHLTSLIDLMGSQNGVQARAILRTLVVQRDESLMIFRRTLIERLASWDDEENFRTLLHLRDKIMPFRGYAHGASADAIGVEEYIQRLEDEDKKVIVGAISTLGRRLRLYRS